MRCITALQTIERAAHHSTSALNNAKVDY